MRSQSGGALNFEITLYADRNEAPVNNTVVKYPPPYPYGWNNTGWFNWIWTNSSNWVFAECIFQFTSITQLYLNKTQTKKNTNFAVLFFLFLSSVSVFRFRFCFNKFEQRNFNVIVVYLSLFWKQCFLFFDSTIDFQSNEWHIHLFHQHQIHANRNLVYVAIDHFPVRFLFYRLIQNVASHEHIY